MSSSTSCKLSFREVEPSSYEFEPADIAINCPENYRDYKTASAEPLPSPTDISISDEGSAIKQEDQGNAVRDQPSIDFVCRRLTVKWEPIFNVVHRYWICRCVLRISTPSRFVPECTILVLANCPRHNKFGISFRDYGNVDYHSDPYFGRFGGYDSFRYIIALHFPYHCETLGADRFLTDEDFERIDSDMSNLSIEMWAKLLREVTEYRFERNNELVKTGREAPPEITKELTEKRAEIDPDGRWQILCQSESYRWKSNPATSEVHEILDGNWSGKPHWAIDY